MAKKGIHPLAFVGAGCLVIIVIGVIVIAVLIKKGKDLVEDFAENPAKAIAEMAVRGDPNLELRSSDDAKGTITYFDRKKNEEITVDWGEFEKGGRLSVTRDGEKTTVELGKDSAKVTGPDGTTVVGGAEALKKLPEWAKPGTEGLTDLKSVVHQELPGRVSGAVIGKSKKPAADLLTETLKIFKAAGYEEKSQTTNKIADDVRIMTSLEKASEGRTINLVLVQSGGPTEVTLSYVEKKP